MMANFWPRLWQTFNEVFARPGVRAAANNFRWLVAEKLARLMFTAIVGLWVARYLGPVRFGTLNYCMAWVTLFGVIPELGLEAVVKRHLISQPKEESAVLATTVMLRLAAVLVAGASLALVTWLFVDNAVERRLMAILGLLLFQPVWLSWDHWFQARLWARVSVLAQAGAYAIGALLRIAMILWHAPITAFAVVAVLESACAGMILIGLARNKGLRLEWRSASLTWCRDLLTQSWPLLLSGMAVLIYMRIDAVMLRNMAGEKAVGVYTAAVRLSEIGYFLPVAMASSLLPALLRQRATDRTNYEASFQRYYDLSAGCAYALALPMALMAPWIIQLAYGAAYREAAPVLAVHAWANLFVFIGVARGQFLVNEGLTGFYLAATAAGALTNIVLNLILIPRIGAIGAATATVVSQATAAWISSYLHPAARVAAASQTRALLLPINGWRYFLRP
jgi:PST family polysaccharide transporter